MHTKIAKLYHEYNITATFRLEEDYTGSDPTNFLQIQFNENHHFKLNILEDNKFEAEFKLSKKFYSKPQSYVLPRNLENNETMTIRFKQADDIIRFEIEGFELAMFRNKDSFFTNVQGGVYRIHNVYFDFLTKFLLKNQNQKVYSLESK